MLLHMGACGLLCLCVWWGGLSQTVVQQITDNHKKQGVGGWGGRAVVGPKHGATRLVI